VGKGGLSACLPLFIVFSDLVGLVARGRLILEILI